MRNFFRRNPNIDKIWVVYDRYGEIVRTCKTKEKANQIIIDDYNNKKELFYVNWRKLE